MHDAPAKPGRYEANEGGLGSGEDVADGPLGCGT